MAETLGSDDIWTKLARIACLARGAPTVVLTTLAHHVDVEFLREAWRMTRKDGAAGVDGQTAREYEERLGENLASLLERFKSGTYRAPPVRRVYILKGDGKKTRPIGIPTLEDKVLQRAVALLLDAVYEQDFLPCSYGFRPYRSAHQALRDLREALMKMGGGWVIDLDIKSFFDTLDHGHLRSFLDKRVRDGVVRRMIGKWLKAGVMEEGRFFRPEAGTPQGGVVSPILANVYLHEVLDLWFEKEVGPRMRGRAHMVRYADDAVLVFEKEEDARRVLDVLPKRFGKYGLTVHPEKTRLVDFRGPRARGDQGGKPETFSMLGFTLYWGKTRRGGRAVQLKTDRKRLARAVKRANAFCQAIRHRPVGWQAAKLTQKLVGHYAYYGVTGNYRALQHLRHLVVRVWHKWLARRSQKGYVTWARMQSILAHYPLPLPRVVHSVYARAANP
jgi:RNA-directed DNA polymerase